MSDHGSGTSPAGRTWAVIDIDGVLADVRHRLHHISGDRRDWAAFFAGMPDDALLAAGAEAVREACAAGLEVVYLTGRPESYRSQTLSWLERCELPAGNLLMRPERDRRPAVVFKVERLRSLRESGEVAYLLDDDEDVLRSARAAGFAVRHADWMGRQEALRQAQEASGRT
ncbi:MAG: LNS2 domain-containing protein [Candidatus Nanopelagicales bacterium]